MRKKIIILLMGLIISPLGWLGEQLLQMSLKWMISKAGPISESSIILIVGLSLMIGGPIVMNRQNKRRTAIEKKARYIRVEFLIVVVGGMVFTALGLGLLLGWL